LLPAKKIRESLSAFSKFISA
jgi:hypothetical protein